VGPSEVLTAREAIGLFKHYHAFGGCPRVGTCGQCRITPGISAGLHRGLMLTCNPRKVRLPNALLLNPVRAVRVVVPGTRPGRMGGGVMPDDDLYARRDAVLGCLVSAGLRNSADIAARLRWRLDEVGGVLAELQDGRLACRGVSNGWAVTPAGALVLTHGWPSVTARRKAEEAQDLDLARMATGSAAARLPRLRSQWGRRG